jgi:uncharacterized membrane-anchored protein YitT (DUF2179 family)
MKAILQRIISETLKKRFQKKDQLEKEVKKTSIEIRHLLLDSFYILLGTASATVGLKGFLLPNSFIDGGVTGISLIVSESTGFNLSVLLVLINTPFLLMALRNISKQFAIKSIIAIVILALFVHFVPLPAFTDDKLLIAVFGGFFLGLGIGLAIRGGAVIDGTEVLAVFISRKTSMTIGDVILVFNVIIFSVAMYIFSIEVALYAMLTYLAASKTVDFVVSGIEEYVGVTIISVRSEEIRQMIIEKLGRGCTVYMGKKGFAIRNENLEDTEIVYTLITRLEISKLQTEVDKIDDHAFLIMHSIKDAKGGMIKKRPMK